MQPEKKTVSLDLPQEKALELAKIDSFLNGYVAGVQTAAQAVRNHIAQSLLAQKQVDANNDAPPAKE